MIIKDLYTNEKVSVVADQMIFSFDEKEFFEARVILIDGQKYYLKGFCFHPESAQKFILDQTTVFRKNHDLNFKEFLVRLNKMRYKFEQYRHVKPEMIYANDNKLGL
jgi:nicotinic acid phosphoribosyltransferase